MTRWLIGLAMLAMAYVPVHSFAQKDEHRQMLYPSVLVRAVGGTGSGTVIFSAEREGQAHTYVLTNHHVVSDAIKVAEEWDPVQGKKVERERRQQVVAEFVDYNQLSRAIGTRGKAAVIVAYDRQADLALLRLIDRERTVETVAALVPVDAPIYLFDQVWVVGAGLGKPPFPSVGMLANLDTQMDGYRYMLATAPIIFGNSGGALFRYAADRGRYELIGVPSRVSIAGFGSVVSHMGWHVPAETIYAFLKASGHEFIVPPAAK